MVRHPWFAVAALVATAGSIPLSGCAQPTPEQQFVADAVSGLGGRGRVEAVRTLTIDGEGTNYNLGQDMRPGASTQTFAVTDYKRQIDIVNGRMRIEQTRTPRFAYFQGPQPQKQVQGLDGGIAFNVGAAGATRVGAAAALDRQVDLHHHPLKLLRATWDPKTSVTNVRTTGAVRQADIHTAAGPVLTLSIDAAGMPVSISSKGYQATLGDVTVTTTLADYQDVGGLKLPARLTTKVDDFTTAEIRATKQTVDGEVGDLTAPAAVASAPVAGPPSVNVTAEVVAPGVWFLAGQSHHSVVVEFADHLMLIEAPQSEARTLAVIAKAKELKPGKPLTQLVTTHHHFDHTAGLRAAIAEGLTVITHSGNKAFVETMAKRPHTLQPDTLAKSAKAVSVETVDEERVIKDAATAVALYHVAGNPHSETMLMAYIPKARLLVEVDAFSPGLQVQPYAANLLENITKRKLRVDKIIPLHGAIVPFSELTKAQR